MLVCYLAGCSIIAPLYVCSGFMIYISRRVQIEAWDIEIGFKKLRQRLEKRKNGLIRAMVFLLISLSFLSAAGFAGADEPDPQTAKAAITKVLKQKDFGRKITVYRWVPKQKDVPKTSSPWTQFWVELFELLRKISNIIAPIIAKYGEFILWGCVGGIICFFLLKYSKLRRWLDRNFLMSGDSHQAPDIMFGLDLRPESLPERIDAVCMQLLEEGRKREAMSLLYRGTLSALVNRCRLEIHASFTEKECCREVGHKRPEKESTFFNDLTSLWIFLAFGHRDPDIQACRNLIDRWGTLYGGQS